MRRPFLLALGVAALVVAAAVTDMRRQPPARNAPIAPIVDPASDPRFRRIAYRQDELLDLPVLAETFRIAKVRCLIGDCTQSDADTYHSLFGEGFILLERTDSFTVVLSRQATLPAEERGWMAPRIVRTAAFSWNERRLFEEAAIEVSYQTPALLLRFARIGDRVTLTDTAVEPGKGSNELQLGATFSSLAYYPPHTVVTATRVPDAGSVAERMANARRVLEEVRQQAITAGPNAPDLRTVTVLDWLPMGHSCGCTGQTWVDGLGRRRIDIDINALMGFSDNRLRWLFGHELGHIARCMQSDATCQDAAEAHALKLMGPDLYHRACVIANREDERLVSERIKKLTAVNAQYPGK